MALTKVGHKYLCIQTLVMEGFSNKVSFKFGHIYERFSDEWDSLKNEQGENHCFTQDFFVQYFVDVTDVVDIADFVL